jgi:pimeloyl-ACP methyl ester carboxylesterase
VAEQAPGGRVDHGEAQAIVLLAQVPSRYIDTPVARFHYTNTGHGPPVILLPGGTLWIYSYREVIVGQQLPHPVPAGVGGAPAATRPLAAATAAGPVPAGMGLQVQRAELVDAYDHVRVSGHS